MGLLSKIKAREDERRARLEAERLAQPKPPEPEPPKILVEQRLRQASHNTVKPIETHYCGYRFRSRLEARWAVFLDAMQFQWQYEAEGYQLRYGWYLPDFWLPHVHMFAEVKGCELSQRELALAKELAKRIRHCVLMLVGPPDFKSYQAFDPDGRQIAYSFDSTLTDRLAHAPESVSGNVRQFSQTYRQAIKAARSARFEHGESPCF